jgi:hypothetical protein
VHLAQLFAGRRENLLTGLAPGGVVTAMPDADTQVHKGVVRLPAGLAVRLAFIGPGAHSPRGEHPGGQGGLAHGLDELRQIQLPAQVRGMLNDNMGHGKRIARPFRVGQARSVLPARSVREGLQIAQQGIASALDLIQALCGIA